MPEAGSEGLGQVAGEAATEAAAAAEAGQQVEQQQTTEQDGEQKTEPERVFTQKELDELIQKRVAKEHRKAQRDADRRVAEAVRQASLNGSQPQPKEAQAAAAGDGRPKLDDFKSTEDYVEAVAAWKADKLISERLTASQKEAAEAREREAGVKAQAAYNERADEVREKYEDFDAVVTDPNLQISETMAHAIMVSEVGPELAYFLGNNPQEAARIAAFPPFVQIRELIKLEAKLPTDGKPAGKAVSKAPTPVNPLSGGRSSNASDEPRDSDPIDVWMAKSKARAAKLGKRY